MSSSRHAILYILCLHLTAAISIAGEVPFSAAQTVGSATGPDAVSVGDIDGDDDLDVVITTVGGGVTQFFENTAGDGSTWAAGVTVFFSFNSYQEVEIGDIDGDGDLDVAAVENLSNDMPWGENTAGDGSAWTQRSISFDYQEPRGIDLGDIDGDGNLDAVTAGSGNGRGLHFHDNTAGGGSNWPTVTVISGVDGRSAEVGDFDGDGDLDVLGSFQAPNEVSWFENTAGDGSAWTEHTVSTARTDAESAVPGDLDGDGDLDVLFASPTDGLFAWAENTAGDGSAWTEHTVALGEPSPVDVVAADLDLDGDLDLVGADDGGFTVDWWENTAGDGSAWTKRSIEASAGQARAVAVGDVDGDGDPDVVGTDSSGGQVVWWQNLTLHRSAVFPAAQAVADGSFDGASAAAAADVDGDGDLDVLGAASLGDDVSWFENTAGDGSAWTESAVDSAFDGARAVAAGDVDGDGDVDVLAAAEGANTLSWFENTAGDGSAWSEINIDVAFAGAAAVATGDLDGDGDLDVLGASSGGDELAWFENTAGDGSAWTETTVASSFSKAMAVQARDLDGDGDVDVLGAALTGDTVAWFENTAGDGSAWTEHTIDASYDGARAVVAADFDGDGVLDVLGAAENDDDVTWWQNLGGQFALPTADAVTDPEPEDGTTDVLLLEIDAAHRGRTGDGDLELVTFELLFEETAGDPLTDSELDALVAVLRIYRDDGDGAFETDGSDTNFYSLPAPFTLASGVLTTTFGDGDGDVQVVFGSDEKFFVAADLQPEASIVIPNSFRLTHLTSSSSTAEMTSTDIPLELEESGDVSSTTLSVGGSAPLVTSPIGDQTWLVGTSLSLDVAASFSDLQELTFTATGLPSSITLSTDGTFSGTPTAGDLAGSPYTITVRATDPDTLFVEDVFTATLVEDPGTTLALGETRTLPSLLDGAADVAAGDVDGDGDLDLAVIAALSADLTWWQNTAGDGTAWGLTTINGKVAGGETVALGDIDGDGDLDALTGARTADRVAWWSNSAGDGSAWTATTVDAAFDGPVDLELGDIDGDGDLDVVGAARDGDDVAWWSNAAGDGTTWTKTTVDAAFDATSVNCSDLDGDGDLDLLATSFADDLVAWWENTAGDGSAWTERSVTAAFSGPEDARTFDVDGDGDLDVLLAASTAGVVAWSENTAGDGTSWTDHTISDSLASPVRVQAADLDGDGDLDAATADASGHLVSWWENFGGGALWIERTVTAGAGSAAALVLTDLDGDGDHDFVTADSSADTVGWTENASLHRSAVFPIERTIADGIVDYASAVRAADLDGDGDLDLLGSAGQGDSVSWFENTAGDASAWSKQVIATDFDFAISPRAGDLDGDGDLDVAAVATVGDDVTWWQNTSGDASTWTEHTIDGNFDGARSLEIADVDGDGDLDVLAAAFQADDVAWWENTAGDGSAWTEHTVAGAFDGATAVFAGDLDGDGDIDIVAGADEVRWWENTDGVGTAWTERIVAASFNDVFSVVMADLDGDGDLDLLATAESDDTVAWWENTLGDGTAWSEHVLSSVFDGAQSAFAADLDGDGDLDVLGAAEYSDEVSWWENTAGDGSAWSEQVIAPAFNGASSAVAADLDGDGDADVVAAAAVADSVAWWENLGGQFALQATDAVSDPSPGEGTTDVLVLRIDANHRGRAGDGDLELVTFELLFEETAGDNLSSAELDAIASAVEIYHDDGDGVFETDGSDNNFYTATAPFSLSSGVLTAAFADGAADVQVSFGTDEIYFVALDLQPGAGTAVPDTVLVSHLTASSSGAEMSTTDIALVLEYAADTAATALAINASPTVAMPIGAQGVTEGVAATLDLASSFSDPEADQLTFIATGLPSALDLSSAGVLAGTPSTVDLAGSPYTVTVTATDVGGLTAQDSFELTVSDDPDALFIDGFETGDSTAWESR